MNWTEMNQQEPTCAHGTWTRIDGDDVFIVDVVTLDSVWILRQGALDLETFQSPDFCGWRPTFENAINGWRTFTSREDLNMALRHLGILPAPTGV